jgi:hypothetical protein
VAAARAIARLVRRLVNGFQFSSAFLAQTGEPVAIHGSRTSVCRTYIGSVEVANNPDTTNGCAANTLNQPGFDLAIGYALINPHAKCIGAGPGATVNLRRNTFISPEFSTWNMSVSKTLRSTEGTQASESGCLQRTESFKLRLSNRNVFNTTGPTTVTITQGYALPSNPYFQQPSAVFNGGIRSLTLGLKPVF